jgi:hypothetical protein
MLLRPQPVADLHSACTKGKDFDDANFASTTYVLAVGNSELKYSIIFMYYS